MAHDIIPEPSPAQQRRSLGWLAMWWIETFVVIGRGDGVGKRERFDVDEVRFMVNAYALKADGRRLFSRVFYSRAKGRNKSGKAADIALFEALGPCRFDHWAHGGETYTFLGETYVYRKGEPVGRPVVNPMIRCLATAEGQTGNVYDSIYYNCTSGPLSRLEPLGLDAGKGRVNLPDGGYITPSTAASASKDGGLETFAVADETHLYTTPQLRTMYNTVRQNMPKRYAAADSWMLETSTMYQPGQESVAEHSYRYAWDIKAGKVKHNKFGIYFDHVYSTLPADEMSDELKLRRALMVSYGQSVKSKDGKDHLLMPDGTMETMGPDGVTENGHTWADGQPGPSAHGWQDLDGIVDLIESPDTDPANAVRYYLNSLSSVRDAWIPEPDIQSHIVYKSEMARVSGDRLDDAWKQFVRGDEPITLGFDGSVSDDSTALVGCRVRDGMLFLIRLEQAPDGPEKAKWRVDRDSFDGAARRMLTNYNVVGFFADASRFESMIGGWENDFDDELKVAPRKRGEKIKFWTNDWHRPMFQALEDARTAFRYPYRKPGGDDPVSEDIALLADPRLVDHFRNARRRERSYGYLIFKETPNSPHKIDACMAGVLAYRARERFLELGSEEEQDDDFIPVRVY